MAAESLLYAPPMRLQSWLDRLEASLRAGTLALVREVKGAAELQAAMDEPDRLRANVCYLSYVSEAAWDDTPGSALRRIEIAAVLALVDYRDRRGEAGLSDLETARAALSQALLGWEPPGAAGEVSFRRGDVAAYTRRTLWWRDVYAVPAFAPAAAPPPDDCDDLPTQVQVYGLPEADVADVGPPNPAPGPGDVVTVWPLK